jgi:xylulokinase
MGVAVSDGGSLVCWRDALGKDYGELVVEAARVPPGSEGLVFPPFLTGERTPHLDPAARGRSSV